MRKIYQSLLSIGFALSVAGCASLNPLASLSAPQPPHKVASWVQEETIKPVYVGKDAAGKDVVASEIHRTYTAGSDETPAKLTIGQRIGQFFGKLSLWGIVFVAVSLIFFGGAPIMWVFGKYLTAKHALLNTVEAIERMKSDDKEKFKSMLLQEQDTKDVNYIKKLKATGQVKPNGPPA